MGVIVSLVADILNTTGYIGYSILKYLFNWDGQSAIENRAERNGSIGDSKLEAGIETKIEPSSKLEVVIDKTIEPFRTISYNRFKLASI